MKKINFDNHANSKIGELYANYLMEDFKVEITRICKLNKHTFEIAYGEPVFVALNILNFQQRTHMKWLKIHFIKHTLLLNRKKI